MDSLPDLLGRAPASVQLREQIGQVLERMSRAGRLPPILPEGETGTGKNRPRLRPRPKRLAPATVAARRAYRWPGNVRELANTLERGELLRALQQPLAVECRRGLDEMETREARHR